MLFDYLLIPKKSDKYCLVLWCSFLIWLSPRGTLQNQKWEEDICIVIIWLTYCNSPACPKNSYRYSTRQAVVRKIGELHTSQVCFAAPLVRRTENAPPLTTPGGEDYRLMPLEQNKGLLRKRRPILLHGDDTFKEAEEAKQSCQQGMIMNSFFLRFVLCSQTNHHSWQHCIYINDPKCWDAKGT